MIESGCNYTLSQAPGSESEVLVIKDEDGKDQIDEQTKVFQKEFPNLFSRKGKITNLEIKMKEKNSHSNAKSSRCKNEAFTKIRPK